MDQSQQFLVIQVDMVMAFLTREALKVKQNHKDEQTSKFLKTQLPIRLVGLENFYLPSKYLNKPKALPYLIKT